MEKVLAFYDKITERGAKVSRSELDNAMGVDSDNFILEDINFKMKYYDLTTKEIEHVQGKIEELLSILRENGYYIPKFSGINDIEIGVLLGELGNDIYNMSTKEFLGFIGWYPDNFTSGGGHMIKEAKFSNKKGVIKKFVYIWMYGFQLHNPSFRLYKKLLALYYGGEKPQSAIATKTKRKIETKCGAKLLEIIHTSFKQNISFQENRFLEGTIKPLIDRMKIGGTSAEKITQTIQDVYGTKPIPSMLC